MQKRKNFSLFSAAIMLALAIYTYFDTGKYSSSTIFVLFCPLAISFHPVFRQKASELNMEEEKYAQLKKYLNIIRFSIFGIGMILFAIQLFQDFKKN